MIKRLVLAVQDFRAQVRLFFAQVRHEDAVKIITEAKEEYLRAVEVRHHAGIVLRQAEADAQMAAAKVRRHRQRVAVGLR